MHEDRYQQAITQPLFRLKSNRTTIVITDGGLNFIVWTERMEKYNTDSSWMASRYNRENMVRLTAKQAAKVRAKITAWREYNQDSARAERCGRPAHWTSKRT